MSFSKAISLAVLAGAVATLVGCAQRAPIPVAENFEYTSQPKVCLLYTSDAADE